MKYAVSLLLATLATVSLAFLDTSEERKFLADAIEKDAKTREFLEKRISKDEGEGKALKDLGVQNYNCAGLMGASQTVPTSAHSVRPADIKIVAALGDSLTAANGAGATNILQVLTEYRGLAFQAGGDNSLETHVTIPNVLKKYNPNVFGWSKGTGKVDVWNVAQLNAGVPGAQAADLSGQALDLVHKMQTHPQVNIQNDWKLVNIFIGGNDICHYCEDGASQTHSAFNFANNIGKAVQILYDNLPRTIVSVTGMFQMQMLRRIDAGEGACLALHLYECKCESNKDFTDQMMQAACRSYQQAQMELQNNGTFDQRDDFTLVIQPFLFDGDQPPFTPDGKVDHAFFAPDCFHFSQYGHAVAAKGLWNNIVQPVGSKATFYNISDPTIGLGCPDASCPFIRTTKNSANCAAYLTPAL